MSRTSRLLRRALTASALLAVPALAVIGVPLVSGGDEAPPAVSSAAIDVDDWSTDGAWQVSAPTPAGDVVLLGADWGAHSGIVVQVRARSDGQWGDWVDFRHIEDETPDPDSEEGRDAADVAATASEPVWLGTSDELQVRTTSSHPDEIRFVGVRADERSLAWKPGRGISAAAPVNAYTNQPAIITRAQWGADESWRDPRSPYYMPELRFSVVHHTAGSNTYACSDGPAIVRSIYRYHVFDRGWWDIAYNYLIDKCGNIYQGRFGDLDKNPQSGATGGFNGGSVSVALMGDFSYSQPPQAMMDSLSKLLAWKLDDNHINPQATTVEIAGSGTHWPSGTEVTLDTVIGHSHTKSTSCPGNTVYARLEDGSIAATIAGIGKPKLFTYKTAPGTSLERTTREGVTDQTVVVGESSLRWDVTTSGPVTYLWFVYGPNNEELVKLRGQSSNGRITVTWDGRDPSNGQPLADGTYLTKLSAVDANGNWARPVSALTTVRNPDTTSDEPDPMPATGPQGDFTPVVQYLVGDFDGDGHSDLGWRRGTSVTLRYGDGSSATYDHGQSGDVYLVGDWDGDGVDSIGLRRNTTWLLRNAHSAGPADYTFTYGTSSSEVFVGDFDADGRDTAGVRHGNELHLRNDHGSGPADFYFTFGNANDVLLFGDWDGDGRDTAGVRRDTRYFLLNRHRSGAADSSYYYGREEHLPLVADFNGDGRDTQTVVSWPWSSAPEVHIRHTHGSGPADETIALG